MNRNKLTLIAALILTIVFSVACQQQPSNETASEKSSEIFAKGQLAPAKFFTGNAYVTGLVDVDSVFIPQSGTAGSVLFEAGARSNWHSHPGGQILIVTGGVGYHQIKGKPIEVIRKGDVVKCPPDVDHWHGASKDSSMTHIYIVPNTEKGIVDWKKPVTDEEYNSL